MIGMFKEKIDDLLDRIDLYLLEKLETYTYNRVKKKSKKMKYRKDAKKYIKKSIKIADKYQGYNEYINKWPSSIKENLDEHALKSVMAYCNAIKARYRWDAILYNNKGDKLAKGIVNSANSLLESIENVGKKDWREAYRCACTAKDRVIGLELDLEKMIKNSEKDDIINWLDVEQTLIGIAAGIEVSKNLLNEITMYISPSEYDS